MPLSTINNGDSSATARAAINAAITGLNNASGPNVIYVTTAGNDTTGDGSLAKPYLTAQKAYTEGVAAGNPFGLHLGVGSFSITLSAVPSGLLKFVHGEGFDLDDPNASLTYLAIGADPAITTNANGTNGFACPPLGASNLRLFYSAAGGSVITNDEVGGYAGGEGGTVSVLGNALFALGAIGGYASDQANGESGTGGAAGSIVVRGGYLAEVYCYDGVGWNANEVPSSIPGPVSLDGVNAELCTIPSVIPTITAGRSSLPTALTIATDKGGNAIY